MLYLNDASGFVSVPYDVDFDDTSVSCLIANSVRSQGFITVQKSAQ